jgi:hypothetical protein
MTILGPNLTGLMGTQVTGSISYTLVTFHLSLALDRKVVAAAGLARHCLTTGPVTPLN